MTTTTKDTIKEHINSEIATLQLEYDKFEKMWSNPNNKKIDDEVYMHLMDRLDAKIVVLENELEEHLILRTLEQSYSV